MDLWRIAIRALVAYIYLLAVVRGGGKRVIAHATPFDFVVSLILGDLIDDALWAEVPMAKFAVAAATIVITDIVVKLASRRWTRVFHLVDGRPTIVMRSGALDADALRSEQLNKDDLAHYLREEGIEDWSEVRLAVLDQGSELSVLREEWASPVQKQDRDAVRKPS